VDLSCVKVFLEERSLKTFGEQKKIGTPKELLWERLLFLLAMEGLAPLSDYCTSMRWDGNSLTCSNEYSKIANIKFDMCYYFGDSGCHKLVDHKKTKSDLMIYDWIAFNSGGKHEIDYIITGDSFVSEIWFYPSDRIDGKTLVKDACVVSLLSEQQVLDFNYSETMARFKTMFEMEKRGMKGLLSSYGSNGKPKHYKFKTSTIGRERLIIKHQEWNETRNVKRVHTTMDDMLLTLPTRVKNYSTLIENL